MSYISGLKRSSFPSQDQSQSHTNGQVQRIGSQGGGAFSQPQKRNPWYISQWQIAGGVTITCQWEPLRKQILQQWSRISLREVEDAGPNRGRLALLIHNKYGISPQLIENYLRNFERVLPAA